MNTETNDEVVYLHLDDIIPNRFQPREVFDEKALKELAVSIKEHGVIQPIIVRSVNGKYEIIAGERRYKASALAGLTKIPAIIRDLDDKESSKVALLENLQRKNLNPIEEARTYQKILELDEMTQEDLAKTMGKSQSAVANKLRLLSLPDEIQDALLKEQISERHARTLLNIPEEKTQKEMLKKVINEKITVRALEEEIKKMYPKENEKENEEIPENVVNAKETVSTNDFVNTNPLMPTAELPEDTSNYGKVTIVPPKEDNAEDTMVDEEKPTPKFINYGEIKDDEEEDAENDVLSNTIEPIDINKMKETATDINDKKPEPVADLDSLLNLNLPQEKAQEVPNENGFKFITPAEEIIKSDEEESKQEPTGDYFKTPDLVPVELPSEIPTAKTENVSINSVLNETPTINAPAENKEQISIDTAVDKIRDLVKELKTNGIKVETNEMNFEKSYQIIIKLDKNNNE